MAPGCRVGARLWLCSAPDGAARNWLHRNASRIWDSGAALVFLLPHRIRRDNLLRSAPLSHLHCLDGGSMPLFSIDDAVLLGFLAEVSGLDAERLWSEFSTRAAITTSLVHDAASARMALATESSKWDNFFKSQSSALKGLQTTLASIRQAAASVDRFDTESRERHRQALRRAERAQEALLADTDYIIGGALEKLTLKPHKRDELFACCRVIQLAPTGGTSRARPATKSQQQRISNERVAYLDAQLALGTIARPDDIPYQEGDEYFWRRIPKFSTWCP